jgi:hypothetical protein
MKTIFCIQLPENLHPINAGGEEELQIVTDLPFRPQLKDIVIPANLLFGGDEVVHHEILAHFIEGQEFLVIETTILKDSKGEFYLECYCEPACELFDDSEGVDFFLGEN